MREDFTVIDGEILLNELIHGESKKLEFKENLPADSRKYIKTVVAFAKEPLIKAGFSGATP